MSPAPRVSTQIAGPHHLRQTGGKRSFVGDIGHMVRPAPVGGQGGQTRAGDAFHRLFAGQINVGQHHMVGVGEAFGKLGLEVARPAGQMRLEHGDDAPVRVGAPRGGQSRADLGRVVRVVINDQNAPRRLAQSLEAPAGAGKGPQPSAIFANGTPSVRPTARAARELATLCIPGTSA